MGRVGIEPTTKRLRDYSDVNGRDITEPQFQNHGSLRRVVVTQCHVMSAAVGSSLVAAQNLCNVVASITST
jgi:hypothetical protein